MRVRVALNITVSVSAIAQLKFTERAACDHPGADRQRLVLMSCPVEAAFRGWAQSPEYQEISKDRRAGADALVVLAKGPQ